MGVEQSIESVARRGPMAPAPDGPTSVTNAAQVTVIDPGPPMARIYQIPRWRGWIKWAWLGAALLLAAAAGGYAFMHGGPAPALSLAVHPGALQQSSAETGESVASLKGMDALLQQAIGRPVTAVPLADFAAEDGGPGNAHDLYLATVDQLGGAMERLHLNPLVRFRDFRVNLLVRADSGITSLAQLKGRVVAGFPGASAHGAIMMHWLNSNGLPPREVHLRVSRNPEAMTDALLFGQVDAVALPQYGADEALDRYGAKLKVLARSEAYPGYVLAAGSRVAPELAQKLTDALLSLHQTRAGLAALKALHIRQTTGTTHLERLSAAEVVSAAARMERARRLFPADARPLETN
jgi:hypothetical protein